MKIEVWFEDDRDELYNYECDRFQIEGDILYIYHTVEDLLGNPVEYFRRIPLDEVWKIFQLDGEVRRRCYDKDTNSFVWHTIKG